MPDVVLKGVTLPFELQPSFRRVKGHCYEAVLPEALEMLGDMPGQSMRSSLELCENGTPLSVSHSDHLSIWFVGDGRYSHWGRRLWFAPSDNSDPNVNGRRYLARVGGVEAARGRPLPKRLHVTLSQTCNLWCRICRENALSGRL